MTAGGGTAATEAGVATAPPSRTPRDRCRGSLPLSSSIVSAAGSEGGGASERIEVVVLFLLSRYQVTDSRTSRRICSNPRRGDTLRGFSFRRDTCFAFARSNFALASSMRSAAALSSSTLLLSSSSAACCASDTAAALRSCCCLRRSTISNRSASAFSALSRASCSSESCSVAPATLATPVSSSMTFGSPIAENAFRRMRRTSMAVGRFLTSPSQQSRMSSTMKGSRSPAQFGTKYSGRTPARTRFTISTPVMPSNAT
mmetsp:Transcript_17761/g.41774  ORF Transcript_17761/g.41774 Transcript_17761/m.41774 type:complete len:258 (+) Transcript_17761:896-1669(+)